MRAKRAKAIKRLAHMIKDNKDTPLTTAQINKELKRQWMSGKLK